MNKKLIQVLGIISICLVFEQKGFAQDKNLIINVGGNTVRCEFVEKNPTYLDTIITSFEKPGRADHVLFLYKNRRIIDTLDLMQESNVQDEDETFRCIYPYEEQDTFYLKFKDPDVIFKLGDDHIQKDSLIIFSPGIFIRTPPQAEKISFIPPLLRTTETAWPKYKSDIANPRYRLALDLSQSFNSISLWEFNGTCYTPIKRTGLEYGEFMSVSIKGLSPQYDSITQAYTFTNLHQEGKDQFNLIAKSIGGFPDTEAELGSKTLISQQRENDTLNQLRIDLLHYEIYLSRNIIDQTIWENDLQYINARLHKYLGLKEFSSAGLRKVLEQKYTDTSSIEAILKSYSRIQVYSIHSVPPTQIEDADLLNYEFTFYHDGKTVDKRSYDFMIRGGFKIDFSAGFAYSTLRSKNYIINNAGTRKDTTFYIDEYFRTTDSITGINDVQLNEIVYDKDDPNIGAAVFAHFYKRSGELVNLSATIGFMINLDAEYSYLLGGSIITGKRQRAIVSAGWNYGKVNRLSPKYSHGGIFDADDLDGVSESQLTRKEWKGGAFVSISYNF